MSVLDDIRTRGYFRCLIRPRDYREDRLEFGQLEPVIERATVRLRGWDVPHRDPRADLQRDVQWIGQESEWQHHLDVWRFYRSGQFIQFTALRYDWLDRSRLVPAPADWRPETRLGVTDAVWQYTEFVELAARLAVTPAGDSQMVIELLAGNIAGRHLYADDPNRGSFFEQWTATVAEFPARYEVDRDQLVSDPRDVALKASKELFERFGWMPTLDLLRGVQDGLFNHRG